MSKDAIKLRLDIAAIPCPRPRIFNNRASYPKSYSDFKNECAALIREQLETVSEETGVKFPIENYVECKIQVLLTKPKTGKLEYPRGDVDNYGKSVLDAMTQSGIWQDDSLVAKLTLEKGYDIVPKTIITVKQIGE